MLQEGSDKNTIDFEYWSFNWVAILDHSISNLLLEMIDAGRINLSSRLNSDSNDLNRDIPLFELPIT